MSQHIKDALASLLNQPDDWRLHLLNNWATIMGGLSERVRLEKIKDGTLILGVFEASWMQELYLLSPTLIRTINNHLGKPYVKELRFKAAAKTKVIEKKVITVAQQPVPLPTLSAEEEAVLAQMNDPQLRSVLQDYLIKCYQERKGDLKK
jgi:hypothetical protein